jgi:multicomponent Na+:H+ antiporter subunit E
MLALFLLWICFNGRIGWDVIAVGLVLCVLMGFLLRHAVGYSPRKELLTIARLPAIFRYMGVLLREIVSANMAVIKLILSPYARLQGQLVFFTPELKSTYARVVLANSITITPGTITVQLRDGRFCVHTIRDEFVEDMEHSAFAMEAARLEAKFTK